MAADRKLIFHKEELTETDVGKRLAIPTSCLKDLPGFEDKHFIDLMVKYKNMKQPLVFRCSKRQKGIYPKPVFDKGWLEFVRINDVRIGDSVSLFQEGDIAELKIEVTRKIVLFGNVVSSPLP